MEKNINRELVKKREYRKYLILLLLIPIIGITAKRSIEAIQKNKEIKENNVATIKKEPITIKLNNEKIKIEAPKEIENEETNIIEEKTELEVNTNKEEAKDTDISNELQNTDTKVKEEEDKEIKTIKIQEIKEEESKIEDKEIIEKEEGIKETDTKVKEESTNTVKNTPIELKFLTKSNYTFYYPSTFSNISTNNDIEYSNKDNGYISYSNTSTINTEDLSKAICANDYIDIKKAIGESGGINIDEINTTFKQSVKYNECKFIINFNLNSEYKTIQLRNIKSKNTNNKHTVTIIYNNKLAKAEENKLIESLNKFKLN